MSDIDLLKTLESTLVRLASQGVRYLNLPQDKELAQLLRETMDGQSPISNLTTGLKDAEENKTTPPPSTSQTHLKSDGPTLPKTVDDAPPAGSLTAEADSEKERSSPTPGYGARRAAQLAEQMRGTKEIPEESTSGPPSSMADQQAPPATPEDPDQITTMESLLFQYRNCTRCGLATSRNRFVFGTGHAKPRMMFIGEGPGAEEDMQGLPFVGRAGSLLAGLILALGLTREDVYITNVVKCRPPDNRNPEPDEIAACRPILLRQIELLAPALIVTLGNVPLKALQPSAGGITKERGRSFQFEGTPVLPTFHPSYLLRSPGAIGDCWKDFKQAFATAYPDA